LVTHTTVPLFRELNVPEEANIYQVIY
jgi:hypothetical protein